MAQSTDRTDCTDLHGPARTCTDPHGPHGPARTARTCTDRTGRTDRTDRTNYTDGVQLLSLTIIHILYHMSFYCNYIQTFTLFDSIYYVYVSASACWKNSPELP